MLTYKINLIYDMKNKQLGFSVIHEAKTQLVFEDNSNWSGYFVPTEQDPDSSF